MNVERFLGGVDSKPDSCLNSRSCGADAHSCGRGPLSAIAAAARLAKSFGKRYDLLALYLTVTVNPNGVERAVAVTSFRESS